MKSLESRLSSALERQMPYVDRLPELGGSPAAVLLLFARNARGEDAILITQRSMSVQSHQGQMAFPGGMEEPGETPDQTAIRETHEEVGIPPDQIRVLGSLPPLWTPTGFRIVPNVGILDRSYETLPLVPNADEIAAAFWVRLDTLRDPETYRREFYPVGNTRYPIHVFQVGEYRIWGVTGAILRNILDRLDYSC